MLDFFFHICILSIRYLYGNYFLKQFFSSKQKYKTKICFATKKLFLFYVFNNKKYSVFRKYFLVVFTCFLKTVLRNNYTTVYNIIIKYKKYKLFLKYVYKILKTD